VRDATAAAWMHAPRAVASSTSGSDLVTEQIGQQLERRR
jgi:hypothetical protein